MMEYSWPLPTLRRYSTYGLKKGLVRNLMFSVRIKTHTSRHKTEREKVTKTNVARELVDTTSEHCCKSPPKTTNLLLKGEPGRCMMSHKIRSMTLA